MTRPAWICECEELAKRLRKARGFLETRGTRVKAVLRNDPPWTGYQLTGIVPLLASHEVIDEAMRQGWRG